MEKSHRTRKLTVSGQTPLVQRVLMTGCVLCYPGTIARFVCEPVGAVRFVKNIVGFKIIGRPTPGLGCIIL